MAAWAAEPIPTGQPGFVFIPLVLGAELIPWVDDPGEAKACPELAVLSAVAHGDRPGGPAVALAAIGACHGIDPDAAKLYHDLILTALGPAARRALEALMKSGKKYEYQSDFARHYVAEGHEEGLVHGRAEFLLKAMELRGLAVPANVRTQVLETRDAALLEAWFERVFSASRWEEVLDPPPAPPEPDQP